MAITVTSKSNNAFTKEQLEFLSKIIQTTLYYTGFYHQYILDEEHQAKRQNDKDVNEICKTIEENFSDREDENGRSYKYCLRDAPPNKIGRLIILIAQELKNDPETYKDRLQMRLTLRALVYKLEPRLSSLDDYIPLFRKLT